MLDYLRPILSRVVASWVAALVVYLSAHFGIDVDRNAQTQLVAGILSICFGIGGTVYAVVHKYIDKHLNPGDAASSHLAVTSIGVANRVKARDAANS